jgi:hypothetical protein
VGEGEGIIDHHVPRSVMDDWDWLRRHKPVRARLPKVATFLRRPHWLLLLHSRLRYLHTKPCRPPWCGGREAFGAGPARRPCWLLLQGWRDCLP